MPPPPHSPLSPAPRLWPLGAIAVGLGLSQGAAVAQSTPPLELAQVAPVLVTGQAERQGKDSLKVDTTRIGKGQQELRDLPQSLTVVTEKLIDDRHLDTLKDVLKNTAGITFLAAEGGEEDIRLRGFPLQATGDVFVDGLRDPAFYERDTFFYDRLEVLRGSASMLFGRGSTGGAVNQVSKLPRLMDEHQVDVTLGNHGYGRLVGDFNLRLGESSALRLGTMVTQADDNGAGTSLDKQGVAAALRWGIGERDEFMVSGYHLDNRNGMNYGLPWIRPTATSGVEETTLLPLDPATYYGMASDRNHGLADRLTASHIHRFAGGGQLVTQLQAGRYERDQRAGTVRLASVAGQAVTLADLGPATVINRGTQLKIQDLDTLLAQSDYSGKFTLLGLKSEVQAGIDVADEKKKVYAARTAAQGGVNLVKPTTKVGTPSDGASIDEDSRVLRVASDYHSRGAGVYLQNLLSLTPTWKLLAGLRYDTLTGDYRTASIPTAAAGPETTASYRMKIGEWSQRVGVLFQPGDQLSFHLSGATSFNTSGDAYSLSASNADIPPEKAINVELGGRMESEDGRFTARFAAFRSTKLHERNTDPLVNLVTLSGKRHVAGIDLDLAGRLTPAWEVYGSYMWLPVARIDVGVAGSEGQGTRPSLTPRHSGTLWSTYQVTSRWRFGAGLNARSAQTPIRNPGWAAPAFVTGDLMAEYTVAPRSMTIKANLNNVTNKLYADSLYSGHYIPGPGRLMQLTLSWKH